MNGTEPISAHLVPDVGVRGRRGAARRPEEAEGRHQGKQRDEATAVRSAMGDGRRAQSCHGSPPYSTSSRGAPPHAHAACPFYARTGTLRRPVTISAAVAADAAARRHRGVHVRSPGRHGSRHRAAWCALAIPPVSSARARRPMCDPGYLYTGRHSE